MPALFFPNLDALRLALVTELVPRQISRMPAQAGFDAEGRLWLEPAELPTRETLAALARIDVRALDGTGVTKTRVSCWAELLPLAASDDPVSGMILFLIPDRILPRMMARLRRAGAGPTAVRLLQGQLQDQALVALHNPPSAVLAEALEPGSPILAFAQQAPHLWVQYRWRHSAPDHLRVPRGGVLLVRAPRVLQEIRGAIPSPEPEQFPLAAIQPTTHGEPRPAALVPVRLWLAPRPSPARESLWVLHNPEQPAFWRYCAGADERLLRQLEAALVESGGEQILVLRAAGKKAAPVLPLSAPGYFPDPQVPGLFIPADRDLRPVLRAREVARALGVGVGRIVWVEPIAKRGVIPHAVEEAAFQPLLKLVEYTPPRTDRLEVVPRSDPFSLGRFVATPDPLPIPEVEPELEDIPTPARPETVSTDADHVQPGWLLRTLRKLVTKLIPAREGSGAEPVASTERAPSAPTSEDGRVERNLTSPDALLHGYDWAARRRELEGRLFRDLPQLGPAERAERWANLAAVYSTTGNAQDAAVCWMNAVWESPAPPAGWLEQWLVDECRASKLPTGEGAIERWLGEPGRPGVGRAVAAYTAMVVFTSAAGSEFVAALPRILAFLDQHLDDLPMRAAWFARLAAARACEGDALGLAHWRDRVLARLGDRGPGLDLDEPSFLRFHGTASAERFQTAREWLVRVCDSALKWVQDQGTAGGLRWAGLDAETDATTAYARFMFAWGLACLGERTRARDWAGKARKLVTRAGGPGVDPATHALLGDLFLLRIRDAQEGRPSKPGLPPEFAARLDRLPELARYSVERLREHSRILEPTDRVSAFRGLHLKTFWGTDRLGERLSVLAASTQSEHLSDEARALLTLCDESPTTATLPRVVLALLEVAPRLETAAFLRVLDLMPDALAWTESWLAAGLWKEEERSRTLAAYQSRMLEAAFVAAGRLAPGEVGFAVATLVGRLTPVGESLRAPMLATCGAIFRALRRLGLHTEAEGLVRCFGDGSPEMDVTIPLTARLGLAAGWYLAGYDSPGDRWLDEARRLLFFQAENLADSSRTSLAVAYAEALSFVPPRIAHGRLAEIFQQLRGIKTSGANNRYFTFQPLRLVDTIIRSVVTDDFALGPSVRGWLDDDEFLIRSRIHRDLTAVLREQGIT